MSETHKYVEFKAGETSFYIDTDNLDEVTIWTANNNVDVSISSMTDFLKFYLEYISTECPQYGVDILPLTREG